MSIAESPSSIPVQDQLTAQPAQAERADSLQLLHKQVVAVNTETSVYPADAIGLANEAGGVSYSVVAELALPSGESGWGSHMAVIRSSEGSYDAFYLCGLHVDEQSGFASASDAPPTLLPQDGSTLWIDRADDAVSIRTLLGSNDTHTRGISRYHVGLAVQDGKLFIGDNSSNGTKFFATAVEQTGAEGREVIAIQPEDDYVAAHTRIVDRKALEAGLMTPTGKFAGRYRIDRNSEIGGSSLHTVDARSWGGGAEAIVIDSSKEGAAWYRHYRDTAVYLIQEKERETGTKANEQVVLQAIADTVDKNMTYDLAFVDETSRSLAALTTLATEARKINLGFYMSSQKGVCRHMALASAWLGGELKQLGYLRGKSTAEVNQHATNGAHEWMRYTAEDGTVTIIDVAHHYVGGPVAPGGWDYRRDEEKRSPVAPPKRIDTVKPGIRKRFKQFFAGLLRDNVQDHHNTR